MRNWKTSLFIKVIGVSKEDYDFILRAKKKKSIAGKLQEIILFYRKKHDETMKQVSGK